MKIIRPQQNNQNSKPKKRGRKPGVPIGRYYKIKVFIAQYLIDHKMYKAFIRCGYGTGQENTDRMNASLFFNRPDVQQALREEVERRCKKLEIDEKSVIAELAKIAFSDIRNYMSWDSEGNVIFKPSDALADRHSGAIAEFETRETTRWVVVEEESPTRGKHKDGTQNTKTKTKRVAITVPSYKFKLYDKKSALIDIGKHLGLFWENDKQADPTESAKRIQQALKEIQESTSIQGPEDENVQFCQGE